MDHLTYSRANPVHFGAAHGEYPADDTYTHSPSYPASYLDLSQMQTYVDERKKSPYAVFAQVVPQTARRSPDAMGSFALASPPAFTQSSSTCSGALSPARDLDYYPHTPSDSQNHNHLAPLHDAWGSNPPLYQFTGLASDCVKPHDVSSYPDYHMANFGEDSPEPDSLPNGYVYEPTAVYDWHQQHSPIVPAQLEDDCVSPKAVDEIHIPSPYPKLGASQESQVPKTTKPANAQKTPTRGNGIKRGPTKGDKPGPNKKQRSAKGFGCNDCGATFQDENGLQKHIKTQHTRPFTCVFGFAGCTMTFASKNEWKRHCASQHLLLHYWLCQQDQCGQDTNGSPQITSRSPARAASSRVAQAVTPRQPKGSIFNRKDLYTQHVRRMHVPTPIKRQTNKRKTQSNASTCTEWDDRIRVLQEEAKQTRCILPTYMECPAVSCSAHFDGSNAWDERMEHVAKHLEAAGQGQEAPIVFGGNHDPTLVNWAASPDVAIIVPSKAVNGAWQLCNPLKQGGGCRTNRREPVTPAIGDDQDAEGEDDDTM